MTLRRAVRRLSSKGTFVKQLLVRLGIEVADGKALLTGLSSERAKDRKRPDVWIGALEQHRTQGSKTISFNDAARAEIERINETGVSVHFCIDTSGKVTDSFVMFPAKSAVTSRLLSARSKC
jgi:hypothetical protein